MTAKRGFSCGTNVRHESRITCLHTPLQATVVLESIPADCQSNGYLVMLHFSDDLHRGTQVEDELYPLWPKRELAIFHSKV